MKVGIRTPSLKKSFKARTTGKLKREVKSAINPLYGKKGMGFIKNPEKSVKNSIYHKTTVGVGDLVKSTNTSSKSGTQTTSVSESSSNGKAILISLGIGILIIAAIIAYWKIVVPIVLLIILGIAFSKKK